MDLHRIGRIFGVLFIATFVTSIAARLLFLPLVDDVFAGSEAQVYAGAVLEFLLVVANIGTAVVLYPVVRRQHAVGAIGYVTARVMECAVIMVGLLSLLTAVSAREIAGAEAVAASSVAAYEWAFLFGPGLLAGVGNGMILGWLMVRTGLVPRRMAALGLVGGPMLAVAFVLVLFGAIEVGSAAQFLLSVPEIAWEASLGIYCAWKGFRTTSPVVEVASAPVAQPAVAAV